MLGPLRYKGAHRAPRLAITRRLAGLSTVVGMAMLFTTIFGSVAIGAHDGVIVPGNPSCDVGEFSFKDDNGPPDAADNGEVFITYPDAFHTTVTAAAGFTIDAVIVKAGPSAIIYSHAPYENLPSIENNGGQIAAISHVEVCYSTASTTTTSQATTTTTEPTTTTTAPTTTTTTEPTTTTTTTAPTTTTTTEPTTTTTAPTTTTTTEPTTTTTAPTTTTTADVGETTTTTAAPTTTAASSNAAPPVSVLPTVIEQTELPQTGFGDDGWTAAIGFALIVGGAALLAFGDRRAMARRTALLRRL